MAGHDSNNYLYREADSKLSLPASTYSDRAGNTHCRFLHSLPYMGLQETVTLLGGT